MFNKKQYLKSLDVLNLFLIFYFCYFYLCVWGSHVSVALVKARRLESPRDRIRSSTTEPSPQPFILPVRKRVLLCSS